jgi:myosin heavy subunit
LARVHDWGRFGGPCDHEGAFPCARTMAPPRQPCDGEAAWVYDESAAAYAPVVAVEVDEAAGTATARHADGTVATHAAAALSLAEPSWPPGGHADNTMLTSLNEANLLENLRLRFGADSIYTYTGSILMALNPYKQLPLYGAEAIEQYRGRPRGSNPPHVYAMADRAHRALTAERLDQSIIVSGESGAGKTETCKAVMKFLLAVRGDGSDSSSLDAQILQSNPILESFGNARTLRNNNSSRFGKFIKVHFDGAGHVSGASVVTYLLEKSRLVAPANGERSYHCFYQLLAGATAEEREAWSLLPASQFAGLSCTGCTAIEGVDDAADLGLLREALGTVGMSGEQQATVLQVLSAILWLGQIGYAADDCDEEASTAANPDALDQAAKLLGVSPTALEKAVCTRCVVGGRGSVYYRPRTAAEAKTCTEAMVKALYGRMFDWIVTVINGSISGLADAHNSISVLDIYGFESYDVNSLEQLCINYANEKLQRFFVQNVLSHEQEAYRTDGVHCTEVMFEDNQSTVDLIEQNPSGIFGILDEVCRLPQPNDTDFTDKVHAQHGGNASLSAPRVSRKCSVGKSEGFIVKHFAGKVLYTSQGFASKNMDKLHEDVERLIGCSSLELVASWKAKEDESTSAGKGRKKMRRTTVVSRFSSQLAGLMEDLGRTSANYIRCIKPTPTQQAGVFDSAYVLDQVRNNGTNEALQLMHEGFPTRCPFDDLANRYRDKMPDALQSLDSKSLCEALLNAIGVEKGEYAIGVTQVWFKAGRLSFMDDFFRSPIDEIVGKVRKWLARHRLWKACVQIKGALRVVQFWRRLRAQKQLVKSVRIMMVINSTVLRLSSHVQKRSAAAVVAQSYARMAMHRREYMKQQSATAILQRSARTAAQRRHFTALRTCSVVVQHAWEARAGRIASAARAQKRSNAAVRVQAAYRGHVDRQQYTEIMQQKVAAEAAASAKAAEEEAAALAKAAEEEAAALAKAAEQAAEEAALVAAEEEAAALAKAAEQAAEEAARVAAEEEEAAALAKAAEEAARVVAEEEAVALEEEDEDEDMTVNLSKLSRAGQTCESVEEMLPLLEEDMQQVEALCNEIAEESTRPVSADTEAANAAQADTGENVGTVPFTAPGPSAAPADKRLSVGAPLLLDRLTSEDDKAIQDFLELNYEMTETIQSIDSLLPAAAAAADTLSQSQSGGEGGREDATAAQSAAVSSLDVSGSISARSSIGATVSASVAPAGSRLPTRRDSGNSSSKLPVPVRRSTSGLRKTLSTTSQLGSAGRTLSEGRSVNRRLSEIPGACTYSILYVFYAAQLSPFVYTVTVQYYMEYGMDTLTDTPLPLFVCLCCHVAPTRQKKQLAHHQQQKKTKTKTFKATIGERVETPCGVGTVLFRGKTDFADGEWVGVELDDAGGQTPAHTCRHCVYQGISLLYCRL